MDVSVVVICWNGKELLEKNLPFVLKAAGNKKNKISEIIVVDDASTDDSVLFLKKNFSKVRVIKHKYNLGYSATCNTGVKEARSQLVTILNLDIIPSEDFLTSVLPHFNDDKVFAVSFNEGKFGPGKLVWKNGFLEIAPSAISEKVQFSDWASGGSSVFRKAIWEKLGGMDELFLPYYFEDVDLGIRARKANFLCLWEPKSIVQHVHESTINVENFSLFHRKENIALIKQRNHLLLCWKNIDSPSLFFSHLLNLSKRCLTHPKYVMIFLMTIRKYFIK